MRWLISALAYVLLTCATLAQVGQIPTYAPVITGGGGYTGPGDVVSGAKAFWGFQAYNATYASGSGKFANVCLPSSSTCFDVTSDATGNAVIPAGLSICNNSTVICTVKIMYDQSGALACAGSSACDITVTLQNNNPKFVIAGAANGCPTTSKVCAQFGVTVACLFTSAALAISQPFTETAVVVRTGNFTAVQRINISNSDATRLEFTATASTIRFNAGSDVTLGSVADSSWHAIQAVFNGASSSLNADGAGSGAVNPGGNNIASNFEVGDGDTAGPCGDQPLLGNWVETGVWASAFSGGQVTSMNSNVHSRWGF